jgi:hypothetical protein
MRGASRDAELMYRPTRQGATRATETGSQSCKLFLGNMLRLFKLLSKFGAAS